MSSKKNEGPMDWDTSDTPVEPAQRSARRGPPPTPVRSGRPSGPPRRLPGANNAPYVRGRKQEATPFQPARRRANTPTSQFQVRPNTPLQAAGAPPAQTEPGEDSWDVYVDGAGVYKIPAGSESEARSRAIEYLNSGGDPQHSGRRFDINAAQAVRAEASVGGDAMGHQGPTYERLVRAVRAMVAEVVRKKEGGGGYVLYGPNKGKKKQAKPAGEFPTRLAAKRAELARFPPKDPEQLKKLRKRLDKLNKDPKKRADAEKRERMSANRPKRSGRPAGARKKKREALVRAMAQDLHERLFHEDELPGSPWDERIGGLHPDALSSDKKLSGFNKMMQSASVGALGDAHKSLAKVLRGLARVMPGDHAHDPDRRKTFMPVMLDVDGTEVGPVHLYVDGGHVKIEVSDEAREAIASLDPVMARDLRGGLMSFQEDHLPKIDRARKIWADRDAHLDKVHGKLEKQVGSMSGVEHHLLRQLLNKVRRAR